jgi:hypothetical protein
MIQQSMLKIQNANFVFTHLIQCVALPLLFISPDSFVLNYFYIMKKDQFLLKGSHFLSIRLQVEEMARLVLYCLTKQ